MADRVTTLPFLGGSLGWTLQSDGTYAMNIAARSDPALAKVDRSLTATTSSQVAAPANAARSRLIMKNTDAAISVFVNLGASATSGAGSIEIAPKGYWELTGASQNVNVVAASGTPIVTIWEF